MPILVWTDDDHSYDWGDYCFDHYYDLFVQAGETPSLEALLACLCGELEVDTLTIESVIETVPEVVSLWTGPKWARPTW
jgi:hypothetical protein